MWAKCFPLIWRACRIRDFWNRFAATLVPSSFEDTSLWLSVQWWTINRHMRLTLQVSLIIHFKVVKGVCESCARCTRPNAQQSTLADQKMSRMLTWLSFLMITKGRKKAFQSHLSSRKDDHCIRRFVRLKLLHQVLRRRKQQEIRAWTLTSWTWFLHTGLQQASLGNNTRIGMLEYANSPCDLTALSYLQSVADDSGTKDNNSLAHCVVTSPALSTSLRIASGRCLLICVVKFGYIAATDCTFTFGGVN